MNQCTTLNELRQIKDVGTEEAKLIRAVWKAEGRDALTSLVEGKAGIFLCYEQHANHIRTAKREVINGIINTSGVESLGIYRGEEVYYCNAGDTYATTVLFIGPRLIVGCIGDITEKAGFREHSTQW